MTEDERHIRAHETAEQEIDDVLWDIFDDSQRICRAEVLIKLLYAEFMAMDDVQDVVEVTQAMTHIIMSRAYADRVLFNAAGNA
jgi:hypothetical protein